MGVDTLDILFNVYRINYMKLYIIDMNKLR